MQTNNKNVLKSYVFMAAIKALIKLNVDNEVTLSRIRQLFAIPTEKVGIKLIMAQKLDYERWQKEQRK